MKKVYLDYAATTPTDKRVLKQMLPYFNRVYGNPSSLHEFGQESKRGVELARKQVASLIKSNPDEIIFTSGGTEANNLAIKGIFFKQNIVAPHFITSKIEHPAVLEPYNFLKKQGVDTTFLSIDEDGLVDVNKLEQAIKPNTVLVSIMHANNEIGTIQSIKAMAKIINNVIEIIKANNNKNPLYFHTDAVQTAGHIEIDVKDLGVDMLSMSAHKLYGPKGIGALYVKPGIKLEPLLHGGEQEKRRRGSTENLASILGFGRACEIAQQELKPEADKLIELRDYLIQQVLEKIEHTKLNGHPSKRLPNNANISIKKIEGEAILISLDAKGIAVSTGSACSSESLQPSHVLMAIGRSAEASHGSIRFSLGRWTNKREIDYTIKNLIQIVIRLREISPIK